MDELARVQRMMKVRDIDHAPDASAVTTLDDSEAVKLVLDGRAELCERQDSAPVALVDGIAERLGGVSAFGPRAEEPLVLKVISAALTQNGVRQTVVEGLPVLWHVGVTRLKRAASEQLLRAGGISGDPIGQAHACLDQYVRSYAPTLALRGPSKEKTAASRLVRTNSGNFLDQTWNYLKLRRDWYDLYIRLEALRPRTKSLWTDAVCEGRIITCEDLPAGGARVLHPAQIEPTSQFFRKLALAFTFTHDLPAAWLAEAVPLHKRRRQATDWMRRAYNEFDGHAGDILFRLGFVRLPEEKREIRSRRCP